jgi:hypothetical protein
MCDATFKFIPQILLQNENVNARIMKHAIHSSFFLRLPPDTSLLAPHILNTLFQTHSIYVHSLI